MNPSNKQLTMAMAAIVIMIAYGSLFPFDFHTDVSGIGPLSALFASWNKTPGRGDFISNILLYLPLGFVGATASGRQASLRRLALCVSAGVVLSVTVELLQYYDGGRDTEATDFYANTLGTLLGAAGGWVFGREFRWPFLREISANRVPALLLGAWVGYRLYPYVPTINLHKYWDALKPVVLYPHLTPLGLVRQTAVWLCICALAEKIAGPRSGRFYWLFAGFTVLAGILMISTRISVSQIAGIALAFAVWRSLRGIPRAQAAGAAALLLGAYVIAYRLEPFQFMPEGERFSWMPFLSLMRGSIDTDVQAFFEKFFLYGGLIWLLVQAGMGTRTASFLVAAGLLATSGVEMFLPDRSAEVTDALLALASGWIVSTGEVGGFKGAKSASLSDHLVVPNPVDDAEQAPLRAAYETAAE